MTEPKEQWHQVRKMLLPEAAGQLLEDPEEELEAYFGQVS